MFFGELCFMLCKTQRKSSRKDVTFTTTAFKSHIPWPSTPAILVFQWSLHMFNFFLPCLPHCQSIQRQNLYQPLVIYLILANRIHWDNSLDLDSLAFPKAPGPGRARPGLQWSPAPGLLCLHWACVLVPLLPCQTGLGLS